MARIEGYAVCPAGVDRADASAEASWLEERLAFNRALPAGASLGGLVSFPMSDGRAWYMVTRETPLTLASVAISGAVPLPDHQARALSREDVLSALRHQR